MSRTSRQDFVRPAVCQTDRQKDSFDVVLTATATDPDGTISKYEWDTDGNGRADKVTVFADDLWWPLGLAAAATCISLVSFRVRTERPYEKKVYLFVDGRPAQERRPPWCAAAPP